MSLRGAISHRAVDLYAGFLVYDDFIEPSDTDLINHTPEKDIVGGGWGVVGGGLWQILGATNKLINATQGGANECAIDVGTPNQDVTFTVNIPAGGIAVLCLRWTDANNQALVVLFNSTNFITQYAGNGGSFPTAGSEAFVFSDGQDYVCHSWVGADNILHTEIDDVEIVSGSVAAVPLSNKMGFEAGTGGAALTMDNLRVVEIP